MQSLCFSILNQAATWLKLYDKLMPDGRFMVNCGAGKDGLPATNAVSQHDDSSMDDSWKLNATIKALCEAFPGQVGCFFYVPLIFLEICQC